MKRFLMAAGMVALVAGPVAPALAQTVVVTPGAEPPPPPPPAPTVIVEQPPPPPPTVECEKSTTTKDRLIGSKTETSTHCTTYAPAP